MQSASGMMQVMGEIAGQGSREFVDLEVADGVGTIRLDRPKMNAISFQVQAELREVAAEATDRDDVRAVVLYGGERVFAAGNDVKEMAGLSYADMVRLGSSVQSAVTAVARIPKPVVAAITGYALGGGCELALAADVRFAAEDAQLGQPEVLLGIIPGAGGTQRLSRLVGPSRAKDLIYTGRFVKADEALAMGLVDRVVPKDAERSVYDEAVAWAAQFSGAAALALRAAKEAIDRGLEADLDTGLELERAAFAGLFATDDRTAGMQSFVEQGPGKATFEGR
jgi:enoyl-CoA hydratase/carnithine racemase